MAKSIIVFPDNDICSQLEWTDLTVEQKESAEKAWTEKTRTTINQLIESHIDKILVNWSKTRLLSDKDIKYIVITSRSNEDGNIQQKIIVSSLFDYIMRFDRFKDNDDCSQVKDEIVSNILCMHSQGVPVHYHEMDTVSGCCGDIEGKSRIAIPLLSKEIDEREDSLYGVWGVPFNTLFTFYPKESFDELAKEVVDRQAQREQKKESKKPILEIQKEDELYNWLRLQGLDAHRQVKTTSGNKLDIWIPNRIIIELKRNNVSGNDVCQAMEYIQSQGLPVLMVGDKLSGSASRGIKAFNGITRGNKIIFVTWDSVRDYLKGRFAI